MENLVGTLLVASALAIAQTPRFEAASVKPTPPEEALTVMGSHGGPGTADPGRWWADNLTLANLLLYAHDLRPYQLSGPAWLNGTRFRIQATLPPGASRGDLRLMLRDLLEERFHVKSHRETREMTVLTLVVGKNGPKFKKSSDDPPDTGILGKSGEENGRIQWRRERCTMEMLALMVGLSMRAPVVDGTALTGKYDVALCWVREGNAEAGPALPIALHEQLGLKLEPKKGPVEMLVIDAADRSPAGN